MQEPQGYKEIRCKKCNKLLFKAKHADCEIRCPRCKEKNTINIDLEPL